jgi:hypothetical protein
MLTLRQGVYIEQKPSAVELMPEGFQPGLGEYQASGDKDCCEQSIGFVVLAWCSVSSQDDP